MGQFWLCAVDFVEADEQVDDAVDAGPNAATLMEITRNSLDTNPGPGDWFTGAVYIDTIATPTSPSRLGPLAQTRRANESVDAALALRPRIHRARLAWPTWGCRRTFRRWPARRQRAALP